VDAGVPDKQRDQRTPAASAACWMRVVLDTNILVSTALKQKFMPAMTALLVERRGGLLKSLATEAHQTEDLVGGSSEND
jgi:hypothetical protein